MVGAGAWHLYAGRGNYQFSVYPKRPPMAVLVT